MAAINLIAISEKERTILDIIDEKKMTLGEITSLLPEATRSCPDDLMRALIKMKKKGILCCSIGNSEGESVWWRPNQVSELNSVQS